MIKLTELMVGNWVYNTHHKKAIQLTPYDFFTHSHDADGSQRLLGEPKPVSGRDFEPIPLTPEILEKNGIHETNKNHWTWERKPHTNTDIMYQAEEICFDKEFPRKENGGLHTGGFVRVASEHGMVYCECEYVHQLQRALRLCGIEKEIIL